MTDWVPVVDISRHQGATNFHVMRSKGVRGLIERISHGLVLDSRAEEYYHDAVLAGFDPAEIGWYPFINPKRSSGADAAEFAVEHIMRISGRSDFLYMLDVENYKQESPNVGQAPVYGQAFADHIREHIATVLALSPKSRVIGYTNRAYWNGKVAGTTEQWVGDDQLASELDWIVARYPAYSEAAYERHPLPADSADWGEWAFKAAPDGPFPPRGATWKAWQFSAGFNRQGQLYGCSSSDLDLNIVHPDAWARWTGKTVFPPPDPLPPQEIDMPVLVTNATFTTVWVIRNDNGFRRQISPQEYRASRTTPEVWSDEEIAQVPEYLGPEPPLDLEALAGAVAAAITVPPLTGHIAADIDTGTWHITGSIG